MIRITGFSMERFMNLASYREILFWDVRSGGAGIEMKTSLRGLQELEYCAEKTGCRLEIQAYGGLPEKCKRLRGRQAFTAGVLFFAAALYILSSFVWVVRVEGNKRLSTEEILEVCDSVSLRPGAWKAHVDTEAVTQALLAEFSDISWVSVGIRGTDATVKLAETIEKPEVVDKETPCDVIAQKDGVIQQITVERGTPLVEAGDVVQAGDVLISSEIQVGVEGEEMHSEYVAAAGSIQARTWQKMTEELPLQEKVKVYEDGQKSNRVWIFGDWTVDWIRPNMSEECDRVVIGEETPGLGDWKLPFTVREEVWKPYVWEEKTRTVEEAKAELEALCRQKAEESLETGASVEQMEMTYEVYTDRVRAECMLTLSEPIGIIQKKGL